MTSKEDAFVDIDVGYSKIEILVFNTKGSCLKSFTLSENCISPGAFTVVLTKAIALLKQSFDINFINISIPGTLDHDKRRVQSFKCLPGWSDVPLADWLEIRLSTNVLLNKKNI